MELLAGLARQRRGFEEPEQWPDDTRKREAICHERRAEDSIEKVRSEGESISQAKGCVSVSQSGLAGLEAQCCSLA